MTREEDFKEKCINFPLENWTTKFGVKWKYKIHTVLRSFMHPIDSRLIDLFYITSFLWEVTSIIVCKIKESFIVCAWKRHSHLMSSVWQWNCHNVLLRLMSVAAGIWTTFRLRGQRYNPLRPRRVKKFYLAGKVIIIWNKSVKIALYNVFSALWDTMSFKMNTNVFKNAQQNTQMSLYI